MQQVCLTHSLTHCHTLFLCRENSAPTPYLFALHTILSSSRYPTLTQLTNSLATSTGGILSREQSIIELELKFRGFSYDDMLNAKVDKNNVEIHNADGSVVVVTSGSESVMSRWPTSLLITQHRLLTELKSRGRKMSKNCIWVRVYYRSRFVCICQLGKGNNSHRNGNVGK